MYVCGVTVYNRGHIGNFRTFVATDVLRRTLRYQGYRVTEVPVSKTYPLPGRGVKYSHIRPVVDWWKILRPLVLLKLRIRS